MRLSRYGLAFLLLLAAAPALAQQTDTTAADTSTVRIYLKDGSEVVGTIQSESETAIAFLTRSQVAMTISKEQVERIAEVEEALLDGRYIRLDPNRTRLLFAPTARPLGSGKGYLANYYVFFPFIAYGVGDVVSLAGGISLIPASSSQLVYAAPKFTVHSSRRASVALGVLAGTSTFDDAGGWAGVFYALGTFGRPDASVTAGLGFGALDGRFSSRPALLLGLEWQVSNSAKLVSENYAIFPKGDSFILLSGGIRVFGQRLAADVALATFSYLLEEGGGFPFFPFIGFAYNFGR